jgi:hypothetical protein
MSNRSMSDEDLVRLTGEYLTRRRAVPPPRDLEINATQGALARSHSHRFGSVAGIVAVAMISALIAVGVLYSHIGSGAWRLSDISNGGSLSAVSCSSSADCWAVGTVLEHESGGSGWSETGGRLPNGGVLNGVTCLPSNECWGVGVVQGSISQLLVEHEVGGSWTAVTAPRLNPETGHSADTLRGVACINAADCWAVGGTASEGGPAPQPLIAHYTGGTWTVAESPSVPGSGAEFDAVACTTAGDCWAVGSDGDGPSALIEHLVGTTWTVAASPATPNGNVTLNAITCRAVDTCWAVGSIGAGDTLQPLIESLSSDGWVVTPSPKITVPNGGELEGIACVSDGECWAVGDTPGVGVPVERGGSETGSQASTQPLMERYATGAWTIVSGISSNDGGVLLCISCLPSGDCQAVGGMLTATTS